MSVTKTVQLFETAQGFDDNPQKLRKNRKKFQNRHSVDLEKRVVFFHVVLERLQSRRRRFWRRSVLRRSVRRYRRRRRVCWKTYAVTDAAFVTIWVLFLTDSSFTTHNNNKCSTIQLLNSLTVNSQHLKPYSTANTFGNYLKSLKCWKLT